MMWNDLDISYLEEFCRSKNYTYDICPYYITIVTQLNSWMITFNDAMDKLVLLHHNMFINYKNKDEYHRQFIDKVSEDVIKFFLNYLDRHDKTKYSTKRCKESCNHKIDRLLKGVGY